MNKQLDWKEKWSQHWWGNYRDIDSDTKVIEGIVESEKHSSYTQGVNETVEKVKEIIWKYVGKSLGTGILEEDEANDICQQLETLKEK